MLPVNNKGAKGPRHSCIIENGRFSFATKVLQPAQYLLYMVVPNMRGGKAAAGYKTLLVEPGLDVVFSLEEIQQPLSNIFAGSKLFRTRQQDNERHGTISEHFQ